MMKRLSVYGTRYLLTLWDCEEAPPFLTSICHLEGAAATIIDSVKFISIGALKDVLLIKSGIGVLVQSPLGL